MRLWNAHRRVFHRNPLPYLDRLRLERQPGNWRKILSDDVVKFVDGLETRDLAGTEDQQQERIRRLLHDTPRFFSQPKNVPLELRKQIYMPPFVVTLIRTPHLAPKYASFWVPLWFNKLDFKSYLKNVYNVDVLHIRSYVQQSKVQREERQGSAQSLGRLFRPKAGKKMTVELVDPFVFPEEEKDLSPWEAESYKKELKESREMSRENSLQPRVEADLKERDSIAQQAQDLLEGKQRWKPSWQSIPADIRIMQKTSRPPGIRGTI